MSLGFLSTWACAILLVGHDLDRHFLAAHQRGRIEAMCTRPAELGGLAARDESVYHYLEQHAHLPLWWMWQLIEPSAAVRPAF
jgi:hypothetical protein